MDLRHLETFAKVAELKSFTKAANELYLTQPTVSKQIVDLERYFDVRLIDRTKRNVMLTKAGEILLKSEGVILINWSFFLQMSSIFIIYPLATHHFFAFSPHVFPDLICGADHATFHLSCSWSLFSSSLPFVFGSSSHLIKKKANNLEI